MSPLRAIVAGVASGVAAAVGVLLAYGAIMFLVEIGPQRQDQVSHGYAFAYLVAVLIAPTLALGSLVGGGVLAPYAWLKSRRSLDWRVDVAVLSILFVPGGFLYFRQVAHPAIEVTVTHGLLFLMGSSIGLLPLKLLVR